LLFFTISPNLRTKISILTHLFPFPLLECINSEEWQYQLPEIKDAFEKNRLESQIAQLISLVVPFYSVDVI